VPYSEHSSFDELKFFVETLQPKKVVPTVFNNLQDLNRINSITNQWINSSTKTVSGEKSIAGLQQENLVKKNSLASWLECSNK